MELQGLHEQRLASGEGSLPLKGAAPQALSPHPAGRPKPGRKIQPTGRSDAESPKGPVQESLSGLPEGELRPPLQPWPPVLPSTRRRTPAVGRQPARRHPRSRPGASRSPRPAEVHVTDPGAPGLPRSHRVAGMEPVRSPPSDCRLPGPRNGPGPGGVAGGDRVAWRGPAPHRPPGGRKRYSIGPPAAVPAPGRVPSPKIEESRCPSPSSWRSSPTTCDRGAISVPCVLNAWPRTTT